MDTATESVRITRGLGLVLIAIGGFFMGAKSPDLGAIAGTYPVWAVMVMCFIGASLAIAVFGAPLREILFGAALMVLGSLTVSLGLPGWVAIAAGVCWFVGMGLRFFINY